MSIDFYNKGELPIKALTTMGVSVKNNDSAIGYFGTGFKFAVATLLREGQEVHVVTGGTRYEFFTSKEVIRGKEFDIVVLQERNPRIPGGVSNQELGFTTDLGKDWELWQAYRELYCNALDEGGDAAHEADWEHMLHNPALYRDETHVLVLGTKFEKVHGNRDHWFLPRDSMPTHTCNMCEAYPGKGDGLYYKGVRIADLRNPAGYNYNLLGHVDLTEDRTLKYSFRARWAVSSLIMQSEDKEFIERMVTRGPGTYEWDIDFSEPSYNPSQEFLDVVGNLRRETNKNLSPSAVAVHRTRVGMNVLPGEGLKLTTVQAKMLHRAIAACKAIGCNTDDYKVVVLETLGEGVLGRAENFTIYLAECVFDQGTKMVAGTVLEEYIHLKHKLKDESRGMQNWLVDKIMSVHEEATGEPL